MVNLTSHFQSNLLFRIINQIGVSNRFSKFGLLCMISLIIYVLENYLQEMFFEGIKNIINFVFLYRSRYCEQLKSISMYVSILMQKTNSV